MSERGCPGHASLADDLRDYAGGALDLLEPLVERIREQVPGDGAEPEPASCAVCPVCALITVLRGGRSELAVRLAEHAAGLLAVLRAALEEGGGSLGTPPHRPAGAPAEDRPAAPDRAPPPDPAAPPPAQHPAAGTQPPTGPGQRPPAPPYRPSPPRHRPMPRGGPRGGRVVQHIEITRDGRGWPSPEPC
ncbi:MAG: hypothetical protein QOD96_3248 [Pseudonocardiales bacterium]|nr:hypothetical protein [Pseudonocardiales bacterium]